MAAPAVSGIPKSVSQSVQSNWGWFLALGVALTVGGFFAIMLPVYSTIATSLFLGVILFVAGVFQVFHAFRVKTWTGFFWDLAVGIVQIVGGAIIYFNPFAGAVTITVLIAAVFLAQGITQILLAFKVRPHDGWGWLLSSGLLALVIAFMLFNRFPAASLTTPGILAGISILFSGLSYIMIALAARKKAV
jgi:uncharacterized membrane protein HdeD (DUF308 family)